MRFNCEFETEKIPVCYHMLWVSLIKEALKNVDNDYYEDVYLYDGNKLNKQAFVKIRCRRDVVRWG